MKPKPPGPLVPAIFRDELASAPSCPRSFPVAVCEHSRFRRRDILRATGLTAAALAFTAGRARATENHGIPTAPTHVSTKPDDRRLYIRERRPDGSLGNEYALTMKGVNWSPASRDSNPAGAPLGFAGEFAKWHAMDIPLMAGLGINTVRVYHDFGTDPDVYLPILDAFYKYGIKVIVQVDSPVHGIVADTSNIPVVVNAYKSHPAILMWTIGNEWDLKMANGKYYWTFNTLQDAAAWVQSAAQTIKALDPNHAISTMIADPHIPDTHVLSQSAFPFLYVYPSTEEIVNTLCPAIDVWGLQVYRNKSFMDLFHQWRSITNKPMYLGECGADSYDHRIPGENQAMQAEMNAGLWDEAFLELSAERVNGTTLGLLAFEFNDEWWKNGSPGIQSVSTEPNGGQPDSVNDEEYFGLFTIDRAPKLGATTTAGRYLGGLSSVAFDANPLLTVRSGFHAVMEINDKTVFNRGGGGDGARGINVFVLDSASGIRISEYRSFDTNHDSSQFQLLVDYLNGLPDGAIVALAIADEGGFWKEPWLAGGGYANPQAAPLLALLGSPAWGSTEVGNIRYRSRWTLLARKGSGKLAEGFTADENLSATISFQPALALNPEAGLRRPYLQALPFQAESIRRIGTGTELRFPSVDGLGYRIEYSHDLHDWQIARIGLVAEGTATTWVDDGSFTTPVPSAVPRRFYRILAGGQIFR